MSDEAVRDRLSGLERKLSKRIRQLTLEQLETRLPSSLPDLRRSTYEVKALQVRYKGDEELSSVERSLNKAIRRKILIRFGWFVSAAFCLLIYLLAPVSPIRAKPASIAIINIPKAGPGGEGQMYTISGRVRNAKDAKVVVYAHAGDRWWVQPYDYSPFTEISSDGEWSTVTRTGTEYAAVLVRSSYKPSGQVTSLPAIGGDVIAETIERGR